MKENPVKRALRAGKPQIGTWLTLGSIAAARFMARAGFPWLTVDMEHTHTDIQTAAYMFAAIADAGCVPLARIPAGKHEYIKMVLDCGAMGIVAPMVMDAAEAEAIVAASKYPPRGNRSVGGGMHALNFGTYRRGILPKKPTTRSWSSSRPSTSRPSRSPTRSTPCPASTPCSSAPTI